MYKVEVRPFRALTPAEAPLNVLDFSFSPIQGINFKSF